MFASPRGELRAVFSTIDADHNGVIDREEYLAFVGPRTPRTPGSPTVGVETVKEPRRSSLRRQGAGKSSPRLQSAEPGARGLVTHVYSPRFLGEDVNRKTVGVSEDREAFKLRGRETTDGFSEWVRRPGNGLRKGKDDADKLSGVGCTLERRCSYFMCVCGLLLSDVNESWMYALRLASAKLYFLCSLLSFASCGPPSHHSFPTFSRGACCG